MRVGVDDSIYVDVRFTALTEILGNKERALGMLVRLWMCGVKYWADDRSLIPKDVFALGGFEPCAKALLATECEDGFYVKGAKDQFEWAYKLRSGNRAGGLKSAEARKEKYGSAQPKSPRSPLEVDFDNPRSPPEVKASHPNAITITSTTTNPITKINTKKNNTGQSPDTAVVGVRDFVSSYCEAFKKRYTTNPIVDGRSSGIAKRIVKSLGLPKAKALVESYLTMNDQWFITKGHDLQTFEGSLNKIEMHHMGLVNTNQPKLDFSFIPDDL